jgi:hypothetical protein
VASEITRVTEEMIRRFGVVLQTLTLASGRKINSAEFGKYAVSEGVSMVLYDRRTSKSYCMEK